MKTQLGYIDDNEGGVLLRTVVVRLTPTEFDTLRHRGEVEYEDKVEDRTDPNTPLTTRIRVTGYVGGR